MSDLKVGSLSAVAATAIGASDACAAAPASQSSKSEAAGPAANAIAAPALVQTATLDAGEQPVDAKRVEVIRSAIASGRYPLVAARIGDAMIAAGILLQMTKA